MLVSSSSRGCTLQKPGKVGHRRREFLCLQEETAARWLKEETQILASINLETVTALHCLLLSLSPRNELLSIPSRTVITSQGLKKIRPEKEKVCLYFECEATAYTSQITKKGGVISDL